MGRRNSGPRLRFLEKRSVYYICWTENGRSRERSTGTADRATAEIAFAEFLHIRQRKSGARDPSEVLITDALADYAEDRGSVVAAADRMAYAVMPLAEFWTGRVVADINRTNCGQYCSWRNRSNGTIRRELGVLRAAINYAHREGRLSRPVTIHLPDMPAAKDRWLTRTEAAALLWASLREPKVRLYLPLFIEISLRTGARKEAVLSLRWPQVSLTSGLINLNQRGRRQTSKRRPHIPISPKLFPHVARARLRGSETGFVIHRDGRPIKDIKKGFRAACDRAGLEDVTPHTLRHTCATWLMQHGVDKWEACGFLGMTMETLERNYAHHHPDYLRHAATAF